MPTLTIEVTTAQAQRIAAAYGEIFTPPGKPLASATMAQVRSAIIEELKRVVRNYEHQQGIKAIVVSDLEI